MTRMQLRLCSVLSSGGSVDREPTGQSDGDMMIRAMIADAGRPRLGRDYLAASKRFATAEGLRESPATLVVEAGRMPGPCRSSPRARFRTPSVSSSTRGPL